MNLAPVPVIDVPTTGARFDEGVQIDVSGHADDPEEGALPGSALSWSSSLDGPLGSGTSLGWTNASLGTHDLVLTATDSQGLSALTSVQVEVVAVGVNQAPVVTVSSPTDASGFVVGDAVTLDGSAVDPEDGALSGADLAWTSDRDGGLGTGVPVQTSALSAGVHVLTLTATDSGGLSGSDSVTVTVNPPNNQAPSVQIDAPADGSTVVGGTSVSLEGQGSDPEDGALTGASLAWRSSVDGDLGTGSPLVTSALTVGGHTLTLVGTDSGGASATDSIALTVLAPNTAPTATITAPASGGNSDAGVSIDLVGTGNDAEDGALTGASLRWASDLDGVLGTGSPLATASLSAGLHTLTLTATDGGGLTGSDQIAWTVNSLPANLPPVAVLTGPVRTVTDAVVALDGSSSYDPDGNVVSSVFAFDDGTPDQTGSNVTHSWGTAGTYTVTLTVTDDGGLTDSDSLTVVVEDPVEVPSVVIDDALPLGDFCDIALDAAGEPHIIFRETDHGRLLYAERSSGAWVVQRVDGPGFQIGSSVGVMPGQVVIGPDGVVHVAYTYGSEPYIGPDFQPRYARLDGSTWTLEGVGSSTDGFPYTPVAIDLDPANGDRPVVAWTEDRSYDSIGLAFRDGPSSWTTTYSSENSSYREFGGGLAFASDGTAWLSQGSSTKAFRTWSASAGFSTLTWAAWAEYSTYVSRLALDDDERPVMLHPDGLAYWPASGLTNDEVIPGDGTFFDLDVGPGNVVWVLTRRGDQAEILSAALGSFFLPTYEGPMDAAWPGVAVGDDGLLRACFFRDGNLVYYGP
ncbi:MAG: PKD domain-containing protein [Deltaproteobacteria bacterium]|nr:MAG: PKD domain-containing protein [Deltaproteobacteria bacterium]